MSTVYLFQYHWKDFSILAEDISWSLGYANVNLNVELC